MTFPGLLDAYRRLGEASVSLEKPLDTDASAGIATGQPLPVRIEEAYQDGRTLDLHFEFAPSEPTHPGREELLATATRMLEASGDPVLAAFVEHLSMQSQWLDALRTHDAARIDAASIREHGDVTRELVEAANEIVSRPAPPSAEEVFDPTVVARVLSRALRAAGADGWTCAIRDDLVARMRVSHARRQVEISSACVYSRPEAVRLAIHEVGVHVLRGVHGAHQQNPLWALGMSPGYLLTEEGLAVWAETQAGVLDPVTLRKYAWRVLAVDAARTAGFQDVYRMLRTELPPTAAFDMTLRVKRGMTDPDMPGAYVKDKVYLEGLLAVSDHLAARPGDVALLMGGKVSLPLRDVAASEAAVGRFLPAADVPATWEHLLSVTLASLPGPA